MRKEVDGIYPGIPSGPLDPGWLRRGDDFPARYFVRAQPE